MAEAVKGTHQAPSQVAAADSINFRRFFRVIQKRFRLVVLVASVVVLLVTLWTIRQPKIYRATVSILVDTSAPKVLGQGVSEVVDLGTGSFWYNQEYFNTLTSIVKSRDVAARAVRIMPFLGEASYWEVKPTEREDSKAFDPIAHIRSVVNVELVRETRLLKVSVEDRSSERAMRVANGVASAFIEANLERKLDTTRGASDWLGDQMAELKVKLEDDELVLQKFKEENDILTTSYEDRQRIASERLVMLNNELTRLRLQKVQQEVRLRHVRELKQETSGDDLFAGDLSSEFPSNKVIAALKGLYVDLKALYAEASDRYKEQHPKLIGLQRQMEAVQEDLRTEIEQILAAEAASYQETVDVEKRLEQMLVAERQVAGKLNRKELDYKQLKREVENQARLYTLVNRRWKETDLTGLLKTNNLNILDRATLSDDPVRPKVEVNIVMAVVFGLLFALSLAFGLEFMDNTVKGNEDVEALGLPFLGIVPSIASTERNSDRPVRPDMVMVDAPKSIVAECCRSLRTNLLFMSPDRPLRIFTVTSARPQEGKTTVANALAATMAQAGSRVLIIDTDMRRPRIHKAYGISNEVGLTSVVVGDATIEEAIKHSEVENLDILPCGPIPPNPAEILMSASFKSVKDELATRYDRLIFDSPPVGAVTDPVLLGAMTDGVVLVLKGGQTTHEMAAQARRAMVDANVRILGALVNDLDTESRKYGYYYYSYYRKYGGYYGESEEKTAKVRG